MLAIASRSTRGVVSTPPRSRTGLRGPLVALVSLVLACGPPADDGGGPKADGLEFPERVGRVDLVLGADEVDGVVFGGIADVTLDDTGRIVVSDFTAHTVLVFDSTGVLMERLGREGDGPGELRGPGWLRVDGESLWVTNAFRGDIEHYARADSGFVPADRISIGNWPLAGRPILVEDTLFQPVTPRGNTSPGWHRAYVPLPAAGEVLEPRPIPPNRYRDSLAAYPTGGRIVFERRGRDIVQEGFGAYRVRALTAHGPRGERAETLTVRYAIDLYHPFSERLVTRIEREAIRPRVSDAERAERDRENEENQRLIEAQGGEYTAPSTPELKPIIRHLWHDHQGRLWVQRWTADGDSLAHADVYSPSGEPLFTARWPEALDLTHGAARGDIALGIRTSDLDVKSVVRVRFAAPGG